MSNDIVNGENINLVNATAVKSIFYDSLSLYWYQYKSE